MSFKEFFIGNSGVSSTRLMTFIALCTAVVLSLTNGFIAVHMTMNPIIINDILMPQSIIVMDAINWCIGILLGFAGGTKVVQKFAEKEVVVESKQEEKSNKLD